MQAGQGLLVQLGTLLVLGGVPALDMCLLAITCSHLAAVLRLGIHEQSCLGHAHRLRPSAGIFCAGSVSLAT